MFACNFFVTWLQVWGNVVYLGMEKIYDIDFAGNILVRIVIRDNVPTVVACMNGYGDKVDLQNITITQVEIESPTQTG